MRRFSEFLYSLAITLWVGALWAVGYIVAPTLFSELSSNRALAGVLAGRLFAVVTWVGIGCGVFLIVYLLNRRGAGAFRSGVFWLVGGMLALALAGHFGVRPILAQLKAEALPREVMESVLRNRFAMWHGVSSVLYLIQSVLGAALIAIQDRGR